MEQVSPTSRSKFVVIPIFPTYTQIAITGICLHGFNLIALLLKNTDNLMNRKNIFVFCTLQVYLLAL